MTLACVIPARLNSKRFPRKLLKEAGGKTVLQRTFESARSCPEIDALYVATDDEEIGEHVQGLGGNVIWTSPLCQNGTERIAEAFLKEKRLQEAEFVLNLQGDHPCTEPETISAIVNALKSDPEAMLSTAVSPILSEAEYVSPHTVKCVFDEKKRALYFSRAPIPYGGFEKAYGHIGLYCYRGAFLLECQRMKMTPLCLAEDLEQLKILEKGYKIKIAVVQEHLLGIDTEQDLEKLRERLCNQNISSSRAELSPL